MDIDELIISEKSASDFPNEVVDEADEADGNSI